MGTFPKLWYLNEDILQTCLAMGWIINALFILFLMLLGFVNAFTYFFAESSDVHYLHNSHAPSS